jgi:hypothetical protein
MPPDDPNVPVENTPPAAERPPQLPPAPGSGPVEQAAAPQPQPAPRRRGTTIGVVIAAAVLVVVLAGGAFAYFSMRGASESVLDKVPANADGVFVAHLDPAASQKTNLFRMTEKFPDLGTREELSQKLNDMLGQALGDAGLSPDDLSWVGGEAGGFVQIAGGTPSYAVIVATDDESAASDALQRLRESNSSSASYSSTTISDVEVWVPSSSDQPTMAVFQGVVVLASDENVVRSVIDSANGASTIQDDPVFQGVMDRLPADNLGLLYVNVGKLVSLLDAIPTEVLPSMPSTSALSGIQGEGISLGAEPDGLVLNTVTTTDPSKLTPEQHDALVAGGQPNALLPLVPDDAYALVAGAGLTNGGTLESSLQQAGQLDPSAARMIRRLHLIGPDGVLTHLTGDVAAQVGPGMGLLPVSGTVMLGVDDANAVSSWLDRYAPLLLQQAGLGPSPQIGGLVTSSTSSEDYKGVKITTVRGAVPVSWGVVDKALIVGVSSQAVAQAIDLSQGGAGAITTDPAYTAAIGSMPGTGNVLYIDVKSVLSAVQSFLPPQEYQNFLEQGGRDIQPIEAVVAGSTSDENATTARFLIKIP